MSDDQKAWKEVCCTEDKEAEACLSPTWQDLWRTVLLNPQQNRRQEKEVRFCQNYLAHYNHGTATHTNLVLVAKFANVLDSLEGATCEVQKQVLSALRSEAGCCKDECLCSEEEEEEEAAKIKIASSEHVGIRT